MPSLTLLAADPHLTPVRARPALAFGEQRARAHQGHGARLHLRAPLRRGRGDGAGPEGASSRTARSTDSGDGAGTRQGRRLWLPGRGISPPAPRRSVFGWRGVAAVLGIAMIAGGLGVLRVWPPLAVVMSGSMAPTIKTGDMVVLMRLHSPAKVGDIVAVPVPDEARSRYGYPPVVIHRVFRIANGQIRTKGDARPAADPFTVPRTAVDAKVVADIPAGGRILSFFHSGPGLLWLLFGAGLFFGLPLLDRLRDTRGREAEATADLCDQLAAVTAGLAHLQTEQERTRQAADEGRSQIDRLARLVADALAHQPPAAGAAPMVRPSLESRPTLEVADECEASEAQLQSEPRIQPIAAAQTAPAGATDLGAQNGSPTHEPARSARAVAGPPPAVEPVPDPGRTRATEPSCAARSAVTDAGAATVSRTVAVPLSGSARTFRAAVAGARTSGGVARVRPPATVGPIAVAACPALQRWDSLPPASSVDATGWAAPPAPVRPSRFQRPGRLIAASLALAVADGVESHRSATRERRDGPGPGRETRVVGEVARAEAAEGRTARGAAR